MPSWLREKLQGDSKWIHLRVHKGYAWTEDVQEFKRLVREKKVSFVKIDGESFIVTESSLDGEGVEQEICQLLDRYSLKAQGDFPSVVRCFGLSRNAGQVSRNLICTLLKEWQRFSVDAVEEGLQIYLALDEDKFEQCNERYCTGIIRRCHQDGKEVKAPTPPLPSSSIPAEVNRQQRIHEEFMRKGGDKLPPVEARLLLGQIEEYLADAG